jgi:adenosine deaminase
VYGEQLPNKLREILTSGIPVTINSDDPAYFGAYVNANYEFIAGIAGLGPVELAHLARNSFKASFIPATAKQQAYQKIEEVLLQWTKEQQQKQQQLQPDVGVMVL